MRMHCIIIAGPRGAGKSTLVSALVAEIPLLHRTLSHTTREPRSGEKNGVNYHFIDTGQFDSLVQRDEFLFHRAIGQSQKSGISRTELLNHGDSILDVTGPVARELRDMLRSARNSKVFTIYIHAPRELRLDRVLKRDARLSKIEAMRLIEADPDSGDYRRYQDFDLCIENAPPRSDMGEIVEATLPLLKLFLHS